jgi:hypothetical protein
LSLATLSDLVVLEGGGLSFRWEAFWVQRSLITSAVGTWRHFAAPRNLVRYRGKVDSDKPTVPQIG